MVQRVFGGAGSGAPDLITVRGMRLLQKADVIIYAGSLVNPQPVSYTHLDVYKRQYLDRAEEWELVGRCYNFLGIASMSRGNPSLALDYYMNGLKDSDTYDLPMQKVCLLYTSRCV